MKKVILSIIAFLITITFAINILADSDEFTNKLYRLKWVTYSPTNYNPIKEIQPCLESIEKDLTLLREAGFSGIITYGSTDILAEIPEIAKKLGFSGVIMGVWDVYNQNELNLAIEAADFVDGYCLGNEGLDKRYGIEELTQIIDDVKARTQRPITTTEEVMDYANDKVVKLGDWIFPNIHPIFFNAKDPRKAVKFVINNYNILRRAAKGKPILVKEVGFPTKGESYTNPKNQCLFFQLLEKSDVNFAYFEAFDQYWKDEPVFEAYWGLFDKNRKPKKFILR